VVFAARDLIAGIATPLGAAVAGVLADRFFEPAMKTNSSLSKIFGGIFGAQTGAGMALTISLVSGCGCCDRYCWICFSSLYVIRA
jgi:hypothetical protein